jgi:ADP-ribose pyrophosphatase
MLSLPTERQLEVTMRARTLPFAFYFSPCALSPVLYIGGMARSASPKSRTKSGIKSSARAIIVSSKVVYRGPVFWITTDHVQEPGGVKVRRDLIHHSGSVVVLAVDDSRSIPRVLLERQYRHAAGDYLWELPAGRIDGGENELKAAQRELIEETGYRASRWRRILKFYASPGFMAETMAVYLATGLQIGIAEPEEDEIIRKRMFPLPAAVNMVVKGTIRDAKTISSVLWLDHAWEKHGNKVLVR